MDGDALLRAVRGLPRPLAVGLSGGADSAALLTALAEDDPDGLLAIHVHHGLRGETADRDEAFCRDLCAELGIPLRTERLRLPPDCGEDAARTARYRAFAEACASAGIGAIALAHHRDDQAETFLLRLLRGSGTRGLGGLRPEQRLNGLRVFRPLLALTHRGLCEWLAARGRTWVEDETNGEPRYLRNRVRHELLPLMDDLIPGAPARLARTADLLREDEEALSGWARSLLDGACGERWLRLSALDRAPKAVTARALRLWWEQSPGNRADEHSLSLEQTEALHALVNARPGARQNLPSGWRAQRGEAYLHLLSPEGTAAAAAPRDGLRAGGLTLRITPHAGETADGRRALALPGSLLGNCAVRAARPGDRFTPRGGGHGRPVREFLRARGVEEPFREWLPLLCLGSDVLAVPGLGCTALPGPTPDDGACLLRWTGPMPWTETEDE